MIQSFSGWHIVSLLLYVGFLVLGAYLLYTIVRLAVKKALRQHQEWLESRTR